MPCGLSRSIFIDDVDVVFMALESPPQMSRLELFNIVGYASLSILCACAGLVMLFGPSFGRDGVFFVFFAGLLGLICILIVRQRHRSAPNPRGFDVLPPPAEDDH